LGSLESFAPWRLCERRTVKKFHAKAQSRKGWLSTGADKKIYFGRDLIRYERKIFAPWRLCERRTFKKFLTRRHKTAKVLLSTMLPGKFILKGTVLIHRYDRK